MFSQYNSVHIFERISFDLRSPNYSLTASLMFKNWPCIWKWYPRAKWQKSLNFMLPVCPSYQRGLLQNENVLKPKQKEKMLCGSCTKHIHKLLLSKAEIRLEILPLLPKSCTELCMSNLYKLLEISPCICKMSSYKKNLQLSKCINPFPTEVRSMAICHWEYCRIPAEFMSHSIKATELELDAFSCWCPIQ